MNFFKIAVVVLVMSALSCKKPYTPPVINSPNNYLVVEGVINSGTDSTIIKISRSVNLSGQTSSSPELKAIVTVESDQSASYALQEAGNGKYNSSALNLTNTSKYRLRIKTSNGSEYISDLEAVEVNPPIDSVGFTMQSNGIQLYVNTHNPNNNTRYYRWDYQETWQFHSKYGSNYITDGTKIVARSVAQQIFNCFGNDTSSTIVLGSSAKLSQDIIYRSPLTQILATSEKLETKYSILVRQYALTSDSYSFWVNLKKNTEQLGSIFDAEPSTINGNIHCVNNPSEPVIGYISVTNVQQKRIFISNAQLPNSYFPSYPYDCAVDSNLFCRGKSCINEVVQNLIPLNSFQIPVDVISKNGVVLGYTGADPYCVDCTLRGTKIQPAFWK
jgi:hypothetical protein